MLALRTGYNKTWKTAETDLNLAQTGVVGWPALQKAVKELLLDTKAKDLDVAVKEAAVAEIEKAIDALNKEDLAATGRTLEQWFADRQAKEQQLATAKSELAAAQAKTADPLAAEVAAISAAVTAVTGLVKDQAIGKEVPVFGE